MYISINWSKHTSTLIHFQPVTYSLRTSDVLAIQMTESLYQLVHIHGAMYFYYVELNF